MQIIKYDVLALTWVKVSEFLVFREVLIYYYINNFIKLWNTGYQQIFYQFI